MFVQIIEGRTSDREAWMAGARRWRDEVAVEAIGYLGATAGVSADGRAIAIARFSDEASARANSVRPEQTAWFESVVQVYEEFPTFAESNDVTLWMGGGSDDARFVQVMKTRGADRDEIEALDEELEALSDLRPHLLGGMRVWVADDSYIDVAYFTSETDARNAETAGAPAELQELFDRFDTMGETDYLDLVEPLLF